MKLIPNKSLASDFLPVYKSALNLELPEAGDVSRLTYLRCSALPYCPLSALINYCQNGTTRKMNMLGSFYVNIGTVVHSVVQNYLAQSGKFLADYKCRECGKTYLFSHKYECCGFPTQYDELSISWKGIKGHIDGVYKLSNGKYAIVDYKTTSLLGAPKKLKDPGEAYKAQVMAYALLIRLQYKIKVEKVALIFIPRDNPSKPVIWEADFKEKDIETTKQNLIKWRKWHRQVMAVSTFEDAKALFKIRCVDPYCRVCKLDNHVLANTVKQGLKTQKFPILGDSDE